MTNIYRSTCSWLPITLFVKLENGRLQVLTFVSMRLDTSAKSDQRNMADISLRMSLSNVVGGSSGALSGPPEMNSQLGKQLFEALATCAMQFRGYIHIIQEGQASQQALCISYYTRCKILLLSKIPQLFLQGQACHSRFY